MLVDNQENMLKSNNSLQDEFADFFWDKIEKKIHIQFDNSHFYDAPLDIAHFSMNFIKKQKTN